LFGRGIDFALPSSIGKVTLREGGEDEKIPNGCAFSLGNGFGCGDECLFALCCASACTASCKEEVAACHEHFGVPTEFMWVSLMGLA
jgi:hypothetical protein